MPLDYTQNHVSANGGRVKVGEYTYGNPEIFTWGDDANLTIGKYCSFGDNVRILLGGEHRPDWISTYPFSESNDVWPEVTGVKDYRITQGDVIIGNDVWIGRDVLILSGVSIGDGAVIGAGAVVTRDVEPYCIVAGNPARFIRKRFSVDVIAELLRIRWWDWPLAKIHANVRVLCSSDIQKLGSVKGTGHGFCRQMSGHGLLRFG